MGEWLVIMVEEEGKIGGWVFQHRNEDRTKISDMDKIFQQRLRRVHLEEVGLIPESV